MPDFTAGDHTGDVPQGGDTNFQAAGAVDGNTDGTGDHPIVLEFNGRKFTKEDLINKLSHADQHISRLTSETAEHRQLLAEVNETLKKQVSAAELLAQIKEGQLPPSQETRVEPVQPKGVSAEDVTAQVLRKLAEGDMAKQRDINWKEATSTLTQAYGDSVNAKVAQAAADAGISVEQAAELARTSPKVFLKLFPDLSTRARPSGLPTSGQVNTQSLQSQPRVNSGFMKANTTKQATEIYLQRLRELGN